MTSRTKNFNNTDTTSLSSIDSSISAHLAVEQQPNPNQNYQHTQQRKQQFVGSNYNDVEKQQSVHNPKSRQKSISSGNHHLDVENFDNNESDTEDPDLITRQALKIGTQDVPLNLSGIVDDAVSRQISRMQTNNTTKTRRASIASTSSDANTNSNDQTSKQKDVGNGDDENDGFSLAKTASRKSIPKNYNPNLNLSPKHKLLIVLFSSLSGFLSPMSGLAFLPAVPNIAERFNTTGTIINVSNAIYMVFMMLSPCIFSPLSDIYGRHPVFLSCLVCYVISSVLVGVSQNLAMFFVFRCTTAIFGTAFFSVGAHCIGDIYLPVERGAAIGLNVLGAQLGPAIGPVLGGVIVTYASWRIIFFVMAGIGVFNFIGVYFIIPETCRETKMQQIKRETNSTKRFIWVSFNPLRLLHSFVYPNLILAAIISSSMMYSMYNLLTPIRYVVDPRFNLTTPIYGALFYLPAGVGFLSGPYIGGRFADYTVKKYIKVRGRRISEDRVRTCSVALLFTMPAAIFIYGWCLQYEKGGYPIPIIALFVYGASQGSSFPSINTYCVDLMPELSGDAIGGNYFARYFLGVISSAACLPAIENIGVGWTCSIGGFITFAGGIASVILVKYGEKWRIQALVKRGLRPKEDLLIFEKDYKVKNEEEKHQ